MQGYRFEQRKKQRINRILNIAIGVVVLLILVFGAQIFFGSSPSEEAALDQEDPVEEEPERESITDPAEPVEQPEEPAEEREPADQEDEIDEQEIDRDQEQDLEPVPDGEWEPVGTSQTGEFTPDFTQGSTNWNEMERALRYATGLEENMIVWRLENGGSPTRARGVVSAPDSQEQPYEVFIEWVDGRGWMPVDKQQLTTNPYRRG
ncbi:YrrS family protein [Alkalihalobacillus oceani]|uniref:YrrS family protein n=1 Tax=Halalkalibacter oceani TaxID=1653776 RepID=UPI00203F0160|nr:YrrS family protein [Halalkalibacter oceani]MCM3762330.1 YrrS family protein [Halalkalibacter oceani]